MRRMRRGSTFAGNVLCFYLNHHFVQLLQPDPPSQLFPQHFNDKLFFLFMKISCVWRSFNGDSRGRWEGSKKFMNMSNNESITGQLGLSVESPHHVSLLSSCRLPLPPLHLSLKREKVLCWKTRIRIIRRGTRSHLMLLKKYTISLGLSPHFSAARMEIFPPPYKF